MYHIKCEIRIWVSLTRELKAIKFIVHGTYLLYNIYKNTLQLKHIYFSLQPAFVRSPSILSLPLLLQFKFIRFDFAHLFHQLVLLYFLFALPVLFSFCQSIFICL